MKQLPAQQDANLDIPAYTGQALMVAVARFCRLLNSGICSEAGSVRNGAVRPS